MPKILVIDDERDILTLLDRYLTKHGFDVSTASNASAGLEHLKKNRCELVISDFRLPDLTGLELLKEIKAFDLNTAVIIITGYSDIRMAVEVIKYGAADYLTKPLYPEELLHLVNETLSSESNTTNAQSKAPRKPEKSKTSSKKSARKQTENTTFVKGQSPASVDLNEYLEMVAPTPMSVVIMGETGTGKEFTARRIHELSDRRSGPFVAIDCGALPKDIAGSEFFGHEQGAFTGAVKSKDGKFKLADGGTLFLDEVGNLSYDIQLKLLRVLQERKFNRVGGNVDIEVDIRILAATNDDLKGAVKNGTFREDLFYRLNEFSLEMAPLRMRQEDLEEFTERFIDSSNELLNRNIEGLSEEVYEKFAAYSWPGNLRELRNVIKRAVLLSSGPLIELSALPEEIAYGESIPEIAGPEPVGDSLKVAAEVAEREKIIKILSRTGNNKSKAARLLNIDRKTLYNKLKNYGI